MVNLRHLEAAAQRAPSPTSTLVLALLDVAKEARRVASGGGLLSLQGALRHLDQLTKKSQETLQQ